MVQYLARSSLQPVKFLNKFKPGKIEGDRIGIRYLRSLPPGCEEVSRLHSPFGAELMYQFKADSRTHAVPKKRKWFIQVCRDRGLNSIYERLHRDEGWFGQARASSRKLY